VLGPVAAQRWTYACAKQLVERVIFAHGAMHGLRYTIVRPFNFIGPRIDFLPGIDGEGTPRVLACFMYALLTGSPLRLVDGGKNRRCFTCIDDAVDACLKIVLKPEASSNHIFNIGNPLNETTIADLAGLMIGLWNRTAPEGSVRSSAVETVSSLDFYGPGYEDSHRRLPDITAASSVLGWKPEIDLETALDRTIRWYRDRYAPVSPKQG
jgi:UDP-apiose/xylose synthase